MTPSAAIQSGINAATDRRNCPRRQRHLIPRTVALKDGVNVAGLSGSGVIVDGTLSTPQNFDNTTVSNLTVNDGSSTAMRLDMTATQEVTSSTFDHVTLNLTSPTSTAPILIGNGQDSGTMALQWQRPDHSPTT